MYLLIRGGLPFDGHTKTQIIRRTLHDRLSFRHQCWSNVSEDCIDLIKQLLNKNPIERITMEQALKHPFFNTLQQS